MTLIANVFPKFQTPKKVIGWMSEKSRFRGPFQKQHGRRTQTLSQYGWCRLYHIFWLLWTSLSCRKSILVLLKILKPSVNTLTADDKCSPLNRDNLTQRIQILLSQKLKIFSKFFSAFLLSTLNFEHFPKKDDPHSECISKITDSEKSDWINLWKVPFQRTLQRATWKTAPNTAPMFKTAPLPYLLITVKLIQFEKVYISAIQNLKTVC